MLAACGILQHMDMREVRLENVDFGDETFRISEDLDPAPLGDSVREVGQLNPVILQEKKGSRALIISGFRRLRALRRIGADHCLARFLPPDGGQPLAAFRIALWDNLAHRQLDPLEKARVLFTLKRICSTDQDTLVQTYLPMLGLASHKNVLQCYLKLHLLNSGLRRSLAEGALTVTSAEHLALQGQGVQAAMAALFDRARFSASLQRQFMDLVEDLAAIRECGAEEIVGHPEICTALNDSSQTPFQRGEAVFKILHRRRNPRLSAAEERFQAEKARLGLPGSVRLTADPFFEKPRIRVEFEAPSADGFREIADALHRAAHAPALADLFRVR